MNAPIDTSTIPLSLRAAGPRPSPRGKELDPITYEVIRHRLWSINQEGSTTIMHASGSPVVHATDYNFGIYMPNGDIAVSGTFYMIPLCTMTMMIQLINEKFAGNIAEGDVFVTNDPFIASVHQNDVQLVAPYFHDGRIVAWTGCMAHLLDVGGKVFADCTAGLFDGFRLDDAGRIWSSAEDGIHCYDPDGTLIGKVKVPEITANCVFGGEKMNCLYIAGTTSLYAVRLMVNGARTY